MIAYFRQITSALIDLIYPPVCAACGIEITGNSSPVCESCLNALTILEDPCCTRCGAPLQNKISKSPCPECPVPVIHFDCARSVLSYSDERVKNLIHAFKYQYQTRLADLLGEFLLQGFQRHYPKTRLDALVPVPLHRKKLREREFNQAALLCKPVSATSGFPIREDLVYRVRKTPSQTSLDPQKRRVNLLGAFAPFNENSAKGLSLLVVDDVYTTGTTVNEVCSALKKGGARYTAVLTLSRSLSP